MLCAKYEDVPSADTERPHLFPSYLLVTVKLLNSGEICMTLTAAPEPHDAVMPTACSIPVVPFA